MSSLLGYGFGLSVSPRFSVAHILTNNCVKDGVVGFIWDYYYTKQVDYIDYTLKSIQTRSKSKPSHNFLSVGSLF